MTKNKKTEKKNPRIAFPGKKDFYVAGIGGSAGSLEALELFFKRMPSNSGIAFVIVQHLDPTHKDILPELLQRCTKMQVFKAEEGVEVRPNCVYVIPPNRDMSIVGGKLRLFEPAMPRGLRMPIDFFFRALAEEREDKAIGIILSGMGTDGTLGIKALKDKLGMVMVQSVESAKYDGMPKSAYESGLVDIAAPAEKLPEKLISYVRHFVLAPKEILAADKKVTSTLQKVLHLLKNRTGHDFSFYKKNTIYRRIDRRMSVHQLDTIAKYLHYLQLHPEELDLLFKELLIGVTNFFRDPEAFETLKKKTFPAVFKGKPKKSIIRVWAVGCSTGEEAYSLAILLKEYLIDSKQEHDYRIQIFATDIDKNSIEKARQGLYPANISADVSAERLQKFFLKEDSSYRVRKDIREMIVFAPQNVISDPPFTKLDILCCRNLLIYLTHEIQKKILPLFHYSLNPSGVLFLGSSETIGSLSELFSPIDNKWKIFGRKDLLHASKTAVELPVLPVMERKKPQPQKDKKASAEKIANIAMEKMIDEFAPPTIFINDSGDILFVSGRTGKYLEPAVGEASMNAFTMAREGLRFELASAVRKAARSKLDVIVKGLKVRTNGSFQNINLIVKPFTRPENLQGILMVIFEDIMAKARVAHMALKGSSKAKDRTKFAEMENELKYTKEHLQTTVEEMETSQEELKSTNEELQSTNEELQSTNEELTTSKEELQSLNEELITVNAELQNKVEELSRTNNDMKNLLDSTEIATIFLDNHLNVKRFTAPAVNIVNLIAADVGRPISHIVSNMKYERLTEDVNEVMKSLVFKEIQVETKNGKWYLMRIKPYRTFENVIDGVVITFTDFSDFKKLEQRCTNFGKRAESK